MSARWDNTPDFYDQIAVDRVLAGKDPGRLLHRAERLEVARVVMARDDGSTWTVAAAVGCSHDAAQQLVRDAKHAPPSRSGF